MDSRESTPVSKVAPQAPLPLMFNHLARPVYFKRKKIINLVTGLLLDGDPTKMNENNTYASVSGRS